MTKRAFEVRVTKVLAITFDETKCDAEFWGEFNSSIADRGGPDFVYLAEHAGWNYVQGETEFIEGIGPLKEMNVQIAETCSEVEVENA